MNDEIVVLNDGETYSSAGGCFRARIYDPEGVLIEDEIEVGLRSDRFQREGRVVLPCGAALELAAWLDVPRSAR